MRRHDVGAGGEQMEVTEHDVGDDIVPFVLSRLRWESSTITAQNVEDVLQCMDLAFWFFSDERLKATLGTGLLA